MNTIKNRAFNVRISFDEEGNAIIGYVHGFYSLTSTCTEIRPVPTNTVLAIANSLGISRSSELLVVKRKAKVKENPQQLVFVSL